MPWYFCDKIHQKCTRNNTVVKRECRTSILCFRFFTMFLVTFYRLHSSWVTACVLSLKLFLKNTFKIQTCYFLLWRRESFSLKFLLFLSFSQPDFAFKDKNILGNETYPNKRIHLCFLDMFSSEANQSFCWHQVSCYFRIKYIFFWWWVLFIFAVGSFSEDRRIWREKWIVYGNFTCGVSDYLNFRYNIQCWLISKNKKHWKVLVCWACATLSASPITTLACMSISRSQKKNGTLTSFRTSFYEVEKVCFIINGACWSKSFDDLHPDLGSHGNRLWLLWTSFKIIL